MSYEIFNEDCLEGMKALPDGAIDLIATDPPYCVGATSNGTKSTFADFNLIRPFWEQCLGEWRRVLKDGGHVYCCTDWRTYPFLYPLFVKYLTVRNLIVWDYGWLKAGNWYRYTHELIIFATNGAGKRTFSASETDLWRIRCVINRDARRKLHPAEKPVELMARMITNSSVEGDTVLDPFAGSATTAVACVNLNRNFIGYELDENFYDIARKRIDEAIAKREQSLF